MDYEKVVEQVQSFVSRQAQLEILYCSCDVRQYDKTSVLIVLDSSFNPPHKAHQKLVLNALQYYHERRLSASVLFLLATNNADKPGEDSLSYAHRVRMMYLFWQDVSRGITADVKFALSLTSEAKFIDKFHIIRKHLYVERPIAFLAGFDTVFRIFDTKYYGDSVEQMISTLQPFMTGGACIHSLTRKPDGVSKVPTWLENETKLQLEYLDRIRRGEIKSVPKKWADNIVLTESTGDTDGVSSSIARKLVREGAVQQGLERIMTDNVISYINAYCLYTSSEG